MSNEQNNDSLLVDQKDALSFYFDALLLPDENELSENFTAKEKVSDEVLLPSDDNHLQAAAQEIIVPTSPEEKLKASKDFLRASKLRQNKTLPTPTEPKQSPVKKVQVKTVQTKTVQAKTTQVSPIKKAPSEKSKHANLTVLPVSPKPRIEEEKPEKAKDNNNKQLSEIVFTSKNDDGETTEQVLIPRSQRLATASKTIASPVAKTVVKAQVSPMSDSDFTSASQSKPKPIADKKIPGPQVAPVVTALQTEKSPVSSQTKPKTQSSTAKEAPSLDLSLFLPKIKTLSEEEIAQQIEALTQAAVSQAQIESDLAHVAELEQVSKKMLEVQAEAPKTNVDNAPSWAVPNFQVLLFKVAGLKLAVPLTALNSILEWGDEYITELPGHKPWYLGLIQNQGQNIPVIDTLQQVVPQSRWPVDHLSTRNFKHIIIIDNARWGLACEEVLEVITLKTDEVKWRSSRTKRRWLLGTVIDHMCALLDSEEFSAMLKTGDDSLVS